MNNCRAKSPQWIYIHPHISFQTIGDLKMWKCYGDGEWGYGINVKQAYDEWKKHWILHKYIFK